MSKTIYLFSTSSHPDTISFNTLSIEYFKPQIDFSKYDYLIITSKQVSKALKQYDSKKYIEKKALCISEQSALSFCNLGGKILALGSGYGDDLAKIIKRYPKDTNWLYLRAKEIASDFVKKCKDDGYNIDEKIVYKSSCSDNISNLNIKDNSVLIFTSPSSIECFLKKNRLDSGFKIVVIGNTTAKMIPKGFNYYISEQKNIESCVDLAKRI